MTEPRWTQESEDLVVLQGTEIEQVAGGGGIGLGVGVGLFVGVGISLGGLLGGKKHC
jgi:hypothetical protein